MDDEYAHAGEEDPRVLITTSRDPSTRLVSFAKELKLIFPNSKRINRGGQVRCSGRCPQASSASVWTSEWGWNCGAKSGAPQQVKASSSEQALPCPEAVWGCKPLVSGQ